MEQILCGPHNAYRDTRGEHGTCSWDSYSASPPPLPHSFLAALDWDPGRLSAGRGSQLLLHTWSFPTVWHLKCSDLTYVGDYILALLPVTIWDV